MKLTACPMDCFDACEIVYTNGTCKPSDNYITNKKLCKNFAYLLNEENIIDKDLKQRRQLNVLIEEVFHAYFFELPEWKARKFAANLGKVIYNKHFKKKKE